MGLFTKSSVLSEEENNIEQSEQEALELDKLEVSAKKAKTASPTITSEDPQKTETTPTKKGPSPWKNLTGMLTSKGFLLSVLVGLGVGAVILFALSPDPHEPQEGVSISDETGRIVYNISSPLGFRHHVNMKLSVPFKNTDEKRNLMNSLSRLKRELPGSSRSPEVTRAINQKDMGALQSHIVKIVCNVTGLPGEKVDLVIQSVD